MIEIKPHKIGQRDIQVPGSKSLTHRYLIAAALSNGECTIENGLESEDTRLTRQCLDQMGVDIQVDCVRWTIGGKDGKLDAVAEPIELGNSGTSMRLLSAVAALGQGQYILTGTRRMQERPIRHLLEALTNLGVPARSLNANGCPPVEIKGGNLAGGITTLNCSLSSQFLSGLLLIAPFSKKDVHITVSDGPVSRPYIDMTIDVMQKFGVDIQRSGYDNFRIKVPRQYQCGNYSVEPDCSNASYFWAAAAICGSSVKVKGISADSVQGDLKILDCLRAMGCRVAQESDGIRVTGGKLSSIEVDLGDMPDMVPTLAVVAAMAEGTTVIKNVAHLKEKESDRLTAVATELRKTGGSVRISDSGLEITGTDLHGAEIDTYNDHRIAMSFAIAGLKVPGVKIKNESCVEKSFPEFWNVFQKLY